jgi:hypothetical protein
MELANDLRSLEKKAYRATLRDGIYDICFGFFILLWALIPIIQYLEVSRFYLYIFFFIPAIFVWLGKKYITVPRIGSVKFGHYRKTKGIKSSIAGLIFLIITLVIYILIKGNGVPDMIKYSLGGYGLPIIEGLFIMLCLWTLAYFSEFTRLFIYSFAFGLGIPLSEFLYTIIGEPLDGIIAFGVPAILVLGYGLYLLHKFIVENSIVKEDQIDDIE